MSVSNQIGPRKYAVRVEYDVKIPLSDGVRISADIFRPAAQGPFPTIYHSTAYDNSSARFVEYAIYFARRGFAWVQPDCRGRFDSEGEFLPFLKEGSDNYEAIEWISNQAWCETWLRGEDSSQPSPRPVAG